MRRLLAVTSAMVATSVAAIGQQPLFKSSVDLVRLDVSVVRGGRPLRGLSERDFTITDNGVRQRINSLSLVEEQPINVIMALDTSGSLFGERLQSLVDAGKALVAGLRPDDHVALVTFSEVVQVRVPLTLDRSRLDAELAGLTARGPTAIRDAVWAALQLRPADASRTLVLVFSDGVDNASWLSTSDMLTAARRSEAVIHAVGLPEIGLVRGPGTSRAPVPSPFLEELADAGGGRHWSATSERELRQLFTSALDEMRARYLLTFYPEGVTREGWHDLKVTVARGEVTTRTGYFVP